MCSFTTLPSDRWKVSYLFSTACTVYSPGGTSFRLRIGYPQALSSTMTGSPGLSPSTVTPKTICDLGVSLIWLRGSSEGSVESTSSTRPSSGCALRAAGKESEKLWADAIEAREKDAAKRTIRIRDMQGV